MNLEGDNPNLKSNNNDKFASLYTISQKTVIAAVFMNLKDYDPNLKRDDTDNFTSLYSNSP
jgi:hypothetical protein